jgi:hypothetical protein
MNGKVEAPPWERQSRIQNVCVRHAGWRPGVKNGYAFGAGHLGDLAPEATMRHWLHLGKPC